jgi:hypothetical protein
MNIIRKNAAAPQRGRTESDRSHEAPKLPDRFGDDVTGAREARFGKMRWVRMRTANTLFVAGMAALALAACATTSAWTPPAAHDTRDDPAALRPGYGNEALHTWWPLTPAEIAAIDGAPAARRGDAHALLALALAASGDHRDAESYAAFTTRVDRFVAEERPRIAGAPDAWHKGYELNRAMHRELFGGERSELGSYQFEQARLTGIFTSGRYNCLSSALLYVVLARAFELPVRGVVVPTHVFVEMGPPGAKVFEIETTSDTGFDWVHDARFYKEEAATWSGNRGLRPVTLAEYEHRKIVEPYQLVALAMRDARSGGDKDRPRLRELASLVDPEDADAQRERLQLTINESVELYNAGAWRTMARLYDVVSPAVDAVAARTRDAKTGELASWAGWNYAHALMIIGRTDEAMARAKDGWARLDSTWPDAEKLRNNYTNVVNDRLCGLINDKAYAKAIEVYGDYRESCRADKICAGNAAVAYGNQSIEAQNAGDWQTARASLQQCVLELPDDGRCKDALADLESRHRF